MFIVRPSDLHVNLGFAKCVNCTIKFEHLLLEGCLVLLHTQGFNVDWQALQLLICRFLRSK
jgi:hypothetical protein